MFRATCFAGALTGLVILILTAGTASAGVYDDVAAWWHLDMADSGTITNAGDIRDQRDWQNAGGATADSVQGSPSWTNAGIPLFGPAGGLTRGGRGLVLNANDGTADGFKVDNYALTGDMTLFMRVNWSGLYGPAAGGSRNNLYLNGSDWGNNEGFIFEMKGGTGDSQLRLLFGPGDSISTAFSAGTQPNTWYDLAVSIDDNGANDTITFYRWKDGGNIEKSVHTGNLHDASAAGTDLSRGTLLGYEAGNKGFSGVIESTAIWNRALTEAEIHDAFGSPDPLGSIGIDNAGNLDLRLESQTDADYTIGEPWHEMRRAVTSSFPEANIHFALSPEEAALTYLAHVDLVGAGGGGSTFTALVNGEELATKTVTGAGDLLVWVPGDKLQTGANTLSLRHDAGSWVSWDMLELGGAWQVGFDDGSQGEFSQEGTVPDDFYVTDRNWLNLERALTASQIDTRIHFNLTEEEAQFPFLYTTEVIAQNPSSGNPFDVLINGHLLASIGASPNNTAYDLKIGSSLVHPGDNVITLLYQNSSGWTQFDFHRLQILVPEPSGMLLLTLGSFGLVVVRRRRKRA